jgi:tetratricopeptide (TPR) repeat protein
LQDEIAAKVAAQVAPELLIWESESAVGRPQVDAGSYELMLRAIPAIYRLDRMGFRAAGPLLKEALALNPSNAAAYSWLAHWYLLLIGQGWANDTKRAVQLAYEHARRAVMLDPGDARGLTVAGHAEAFLRKRPLAALQLHAQALDLNPNLAIAWCYSGLANSYIGRHAEAIEQIRRAQQLSPYDPHRFFFDMSMVMPLLLTGDYENAAQIGRRAREANPDLSSVYKGLIATLGLMGRIEEARTLRRELARLEPHFSVQDAIERSPLTRHEDLRQYADGLRLAGCEERVRPKGLQECWKPIAARWRQFTHLGSYRSGAHYLESGSIADGALAEVAADPRG